MQLFHIISIIVPLFFVTIVPRFIEGSTTVTTRQRLPLYFAAALFLVSWYIPSPHIDGMDTSFMTHLIGGGMFSGFIWLYLKSVYRWNASWHLEAFSLFALVSALGCINELFELFMVQTAAANILIRDTNWDILANTLGVLIVYLGYKLYDSRH